MSLVAKTPLHTYVRRTDKNKYDCLFALLVYGKCNVNMENEQGMAPLHVAAKVRVVEGGRGKSPIN